MHANLIDMQGGIGSATASGESSRTRNPHTSSEKIDKRREMEQKRAKEEASALKKELDVKTRRIAELETRVEELTILAQVCS